MDAAEVERQFPVIAVLQAAPGWKVLRYRRQGGARVASPDGFGGWSTMAVPLARVGLRVGPADFTVGAETPMAYGGAVPVSALYGSDDANLYDNDFIALIKPGESIEEAFRRVRGTER